MKPYLIFSKNRYANGFQVEDFANREDAATRALGKEDGETIIAARLLTLRVSLDDAPEWFESEPPPQPEPQPEPQDSGTLAPVAELLDEGKIPF